MHKNRNESFLGTQICGKNIEELNNEISSSISTLEKIIIISQNLHSLYLQFKDEKLNLIQRDSIVRIDGMLIVFLAKLFGLKNISREHRVTWMDWKDPFFEMCNRKKYKLFYVGSHPSLEERIGEFFKNQYPQIQFENQNGYFEVGSEKESALIERMNKFKPDILLVGMGMPRQEYWVYDNYKEVEASAFLTCGAAMEYVVGMVRIPPRWMGKLGLEWLYRLLEKPGRFYGRYLIEPWKLLYQIVKYYRKRK